MAPPHYNSNTTARLHTNVAESLTIRLQTPVDAVLHRSLLPASEYLERFPISHLHQESLLWAGLTMSKPQSYRQSGQTRACRFCGQMKNLRGIAGHEVSCQAKMQEQRELEELELRTAQGEFVFCHCKDC